MSDPIRVAWAREYAERFREQKYVSMRPEEILAFVEAVEAYEAWTHAPNQSAMRRGRIRAEAAMERFDFTPLPSVSAEPPAEAEPEEAT